MEGPLLTEGPSACISSILISFHQAMQLFKIIPVQIVMDVRDTNDRFDLERFREHVVKHRYSKILILWGSQPLVDLLRWYQFIEYHEGVSDIIKCLKDYSEEYYS